MTTMEPGLVEGSEPPAHGPFVDGRSLIRTNDFGDQLSLSFRANRIVVAFLGHQFEPPSSKLHSESQC
jgi:hypothetical protein